MAADQSQLQKWRGRWSKEQRPYRSFCVISESLSSQEFRVGTTFFEKYKSSGAPKWHCERWFKIVCSIYWTKIISTTDDGNISDEHYIKATRMRRTSRRSIRLCPGQSGRCTGVLENSRVRLSRHLDSSTTTQMAKITAQDGTPSRSSWKESVRSSFGRTINGKGNSRKFF